MHVRFLAVIACLVVVNTAANAAVTLNGAALAHAQARPDVTVAIAEVRETGSPVIRLVPGIKRYGVSISTKSPIPVLEAELPISSTSAHFSVGVDGRTFRSCVVASLATDPQDNDRLVYALRCEDVTIP
jgi:hypothetical protein